MKIYNTPQGTVAEQDDNFYLLPGIDWNSIINDDNALDKITQAIATATKAESTVVEKTFPVIGSSQELWACGVTYYRSMIGRQEESKAAGGGDFYSKVYDAERPECFFKSTPQRVVGNNGYVRIRKDSTWDVPEPELTLVVTSSGKIIGYTIGNDMSSRSIEGENPLYLPQAKTYDGCAATGPCIYLTNEPLPATTGINLSITRAGKLMFEGNININQMKRTPLELVSFIFRECSFPNGCMIMTGTGIVPGSDFTLHSGDVISIVIDNIGTLTNTVE